MEEGVPKGPENCLQKSNLPLPATHMKQEELRQHLEGDARIRQGHDKGSQPHVDTSISEAFLKYKNAEKCKLLLNAVKLNAYDPKVPQKIKLLTLHGMVHDMLGPKKGKWMVTLDLTNWFYGVYACQRVGERFSWSQGREALQIHQAAFWVVLQPSSLPIACKVSGPLGVTKIMSQGRLSCLS